MSEQPSGVEAVEARYLGEGLARIESGLAEFRAEVRAELGKVPTHSDLGSLRLLMEKEVELLTQRLEQNRERHAAALSVLQKEKDAVEAKIQAIEADTKKTREEKDKLQRHFLYAVISGVGGLVATNVWQGIT